MSRRLLKKIRNAILTGNYDLTHHAIDEMVEDGFANFVSVQLRVTQKGIVQKRVADREVFKHRDGFVILENVPIGVCDKCGYRYYHASLLHRVEDIAERKESATRMETVPVANFA